MVYGCLHSLGSEQYSVGLQVRGLVFEANGSLAALAELVGGACQRLAAANVPHNLFIADCGARVFLLPNAFAERKVRAARSHSSCQVCWGYSGCCLAAW